MAATLSGLPTELLLMIIESKPDSSDLPGPRPVHEPVSVVEHARQGRLFHTLRATFAGINAKLLNRLGKTYFSTITIEVSEANLVKLHDMAKSSFGMCTCNLILNVDSIFKEHWHDGFVLEYRIVQSVVNFIASESFSRTVHAVLPKFSNLTSIQIRSPLILDELEEDKRPKLDRCWLSVVKKLLAVSFTVLPMLEELSIPYDWDRLPVPISAFEILDVFRPQPSSRLKKLQLYLIADLAEGRFQLSCCWGHRLIFIYRTCPHGHTMSRRLLFQADRFDRPSVILLQVITFRFCATIWHSSIPKSASS
jgi:hypothetical protein